jgi:hypothetical protein
MSPLIRSTFVPMVLICCLIPSRFTQAAPGIKDDAGFFKDNNAGADNYEAFRQDITKAVQFNNRGLAWYARRIMTRPSRIIARRSA